MAPNIVAVAAASAVAVNANENPPNPPTTNNNNSKQAGGSNRQSGSNHKKSKSKQSRNHNANNKSSKKQNQQQQQQQNQHEDSFFNNKTNRGWVVIGTMILSLYLIMVVIISLQHLIEPGKAKQLSQAGLATTITQNRNINRGIPVLTTTTQNNINNIINNVNNNKPPVTVAFEMGHVHNIAFFNCNLNSYMDDDDEDDMTPRDLVILDAGRYFSSSQEEKDQKNGGNVNKIGEFDNERSFVELCNFAKGTLRTVTAIEIATIAETKQILDVLQYLQMQNKIHTLPLAGLITPPGGPSSNSILDWILYGDIPTLQNQVSQRWIPVSPHLKLNDSLSYLQALSWTILAIYGENDDMGRESSELLEKHVAGGNGNVQTRSLPNVGVDIDIHDPVGYSKTVVEYFANEFGSQKKLASIMELVGQAEEK